MELRKPIQRNIVVTQTKGRQLRPYAIRYPVTIENPGQAGQYISNWIWFVFNLEYTFYSCETLRQVLGFYPGENAFDEKSPITDLRLNNSSELGKIGALGQLSVTLRPVNPAQTYGNLGIEHKTAFLFCLDKAPRTVATELKTIKIRIAETDVYYEVVPGSITLKKSKKTTPHFG
jgi:hypothetical protein